MNRWRIKTAKQRALLPARKEPYFEVLDAKGLAVGVYRGARGDRWVSRCPSGGAPRWRTAVLGYTEDMAYTDAVTAAQAWRQEARDEATPMTVAEAAQVWLDGKLKATGAISADRTTNGWRSMAKRVEALFGPDRLIASITISECHDFRDRPKADGSPRKRSAGDRDLAAAKAMFTAGADAIGLEGPRPWAKAKKHGDKLTALESLDAADADLDVALTTEELRRLIAAAATFSPAYADYLRAAVLTLQRPTALRMADVRDFDLDARTIRYRRGKNARKRGAIIVGMFDATAGLFTRLAEGKEPTAPLLTDDDGKRWGESFQTDRFAKALQIANIDKQVTPYGVRHSAITRAIKEDRLDPGTVAKLADTSLEIICNAYFRPSGDLGAGPEL
jgi:integrase